MSKLLDNIIIGSVIGFFIIVFIGLTFPNKDEKNHIIYKSYFQDKRFENQLNAIYDQLSYKNNIKSNKNKHIKKKSKNKKK